MTDAELTGQMHAPPPHYAIFLEVEGQVRVRCNAMNDSEEKRLRDWIRNRPQLRELLEHATRLEDQTKAGSR